MSGRSRPLPLTLHPPPHLKRGRLFFIPLMKIWHITYVLRFYLCWNIDNVVNTMTLTILYLILHTIILKLCGKNVCILHITLLCIRIRVIRWWKLSCFLNRLFCRCDPNFHTKLLVWGPPMGHNASLLIRVYFKLIKYCMIWNHAIFTKITILNFFITSFIQTFT